MMIKKTAKIVTLLLAAALCLCSCGKSLKDIKITSYEVTSVAPRGLSAFDATIDLGVNNPSVQFSLSAISATVKMDGTPCLYLTADDVKKDLEGLQCMRNLARNMVFMIKAIADAKEKYGAPVVEQEAFTSFPDGK